MTKKECFGTALLKATLGDSRIEFASAGLRYEVGVPLAGVLPHETLQPDLIATDLNFGTDHPKNQEASH